MTEPRENNFERALRLGKQCLVEFLEQGAEITLKIDKERADKIHSMVPYRYDATDSLSERFLCAADPDLTGLAEVLVVDQILKQVQGEGYNVYRSHKDVVIRKAPKPE